MEKVIYLAIFQKRDHEEKSGKTVHIFRVNDELN
jgi:hypothetical protein